MATAPGAGTSNGGGQQQQQQQRRRRRQQQEQQEQQQAPSRATRESLQESFGKTAAAVADAILAGDLDWAYDTYIVIPLLVRQAGVLVRQAGVPDVPDVPAACRAAAALRAVVVSQPGLAPVMVTLGAAAAADALLIRAPLAAVETVAALYRGLVDGLHAVGRATGPEQGTKLPPHAFPAGVGAALAAAICSGDRGKLEAACGLAALLCVDGSFKAPLLGPRALAALYGALAEGPPSPAVLDAIWHFEMLEEKGEMGPDDARSMRALVGVLERANGGCEASAALLGRAVELLTARFEASQGSAEAAAQCVIEHGLAGALAEALCGALADEESGDLWEQLLAILKDTAQLTGPCAADVAGAMVDAMHRYAARVPDERARLEEDMRGFLAQPPFSMSDPAFDALRAASARAAALEREIAQREAMPLNLQQAVVGLAAHARRSGGGGSGGGGGGGGGAS